MMTYKHCTALAASLVLAVLAWNYAGRLFDTDDKSTDASSGLVMLLSGAGCFDISIGKLDAEVDVEISLVELGLNDANVPVVKNRKTIFSTSYPRGLRSGLAVYRVLVSIVPFAATDETVSKSHVIENKDPSVTGYLYFEPRVNRNIESESNIVGPGRKAIYIPRRFSVPGSAFGGLTLPVTSNQGNYAIAKVGEEYPFFRFSASQSVQSGKPDVIYELRLIEKLRKPIEN